MKVGTLSLVFLIMWLDFLLLVAYLKLKLDIFLFIVSNKMVILSIYDLFLQPFNLDVDSRATYEVYGECCAV